MRKSFERSRRMSLSDSASAVRRVSGGTRGGRRERGCAPGPVYLPLIARSACSTRRLVM